MSNIVSGTIQRPTGCDGIEIWHIGNVYGYGVKMFVYRNKGSFVSKEEMETFLFKSMLSLSLYGLLDQLKVSCKGFHTNSISITEEERSVNEKLAKNHATMVRYALHLLNEKYPTYMTFN